MLRNVDTRLVWRWYKTGLMPHGAWPLQSNSPKPEQVFQLMPQVATSTEKLGKAVQVVECSLLKNALLPPPGLFDELWDLLLSSLLPLWATFWKAWLQRAPETTHRPHVGWPY